MLTNNPVQFIKGVFVYLVIEKTIGLKYKRVETTDTNTKYVILDSEIWGQEISHHSHSPMGMIFQWMWNMFLGGSRQLQHQISGSKIPPGYSFHGFELRGYNHLCKLRSPTGFRMSPYWAIKQLNFYSNLADEKCKLQLNELEEIHNEA